MMMMMMTMMQNVSLTNDFLQVVCPNFCSLLGSVYTGDRGAALKVGGGALTSNSKCGVAENTFSQ